MKYRIALIGLFLIVSCGRSQEQPVIEPTDQDQTQQNYGGDGIDYQNGRNGRLAEKIDFPPETSELIDTENTDYDQYPQAPDSPKDHSEFKLIMGILGTLFQGGLGGGLISPQSSDSNRLNPSSGVLRPGGVSPGSAISPSSPPQSSPLIQGLASMHQDLLQRHNAIRQKNRLNPLSINRELTNAATSHAETLANAQYRTQADGIPRSHTYGGTTFGQRARSAGYSGSPATENWALNSRVSSAMNSWMLSDGHRRNILHSGVNEVGFGTVKEVGGSIHFVVVFGKR